MGQRLAVTSNVLINVTVGRLTIRAPLNKDKWYITHCEWQFDNETIIRTDKE